MASNIYAMHHLHYINIFNIGQPVYM